MSYVELKHLCADLALEAVRHPDRASWTALAAAYASLASPAAPVIARDRVQRRAVDLAERFGWHPDHAEVAFLVDRGLLKAQTDALTAHAPFVPHLPYLTRQAPRLLDALWTLRTRGPRDVTDLERGVALFNAGLFFECHELLEGVWRATSGQAKNFYHGIVQIAAAFYHIEKRNRHGARTLLAKGLKRLEDYPQEYLTVKLGAFHAALKPWIQSLTAGMLPESRPYPRIELW